MSIKSSKRSSKFTLFFYNLGFISAVKVAQTGSMGAVWAFYKLKLRASKSECLGDFFFKLIHGLSSDTSVLAVIPTPDSTLPI